MLKSYSEAFKSKMVAKLLHLEGPSVLTLSEKLGLSKSTLYKWIKKAKESKESKGCKMSSSKIDSNTRINKKTNDRKFQAVINTINLTEQEVSAYCRKNGFYVQDIEKWKNKMLLGLNNNNNLINKQELRVSKAKTKELEKELYRKEKALAEISALLILKKKVTALLEE